MNDYDEDLFLTLSTEDLKAIENAEKYEPSFTSQKPNENELLRTVGENKILRDKIHFVENEKQRLKVELLNLRKEMNDEKLKLQTQFAMDIDKFKTDLVRQENLFHFSISRHNIASC